MKRYFVGKKCPKKIFVPKKLNVKKILMSKNIKPKLFLCPKIFLNPNNLEEEFSVGGSRKNVKKS